VTTVSSGNHGLSLAWAAHRLGLECEIRVPAGASPRKVRAIEALGAVTSPMSREELVRTHMEELWRSWPRTFIHPFSHAHTVAGQGTAGWEIAEDLPEVRTVLVPCGGGGLVAGVAVAVKSQNPDAKVYAVQAEGSAPLPEAFRTGRPAHVDEPETFADGIRIGIILPEMFPLLRNHLDGCLTVSDSDIRKAIRRLAFEAKVVAEPAGAASFASWLRYGETLEPPVVAVLSGGNIEPALLSEVLPR
jgi:threonine dehydratase